MTSPIDNLQGTARFRIERVMTDTLQGRVYAGTDLITKKQVVIKEAWRQLVHSGRSRKGYRIPEDFLKERRLIMELSNLSECPQGLIKGIAEWDDQNCYYYAMECCESELFDYISTNHNQTAYRRFVTEEARKEQIPMETPNNWVQNVSKLFYQICQSIKWLHDSGYCHLDVSLENAMLYDVENLNVKIIDFGLAQKFDTNFNFRGRIGKVQYMCPEAYAQQSYDARAADVYCLGVMLFIMLIGAPPYQTPQPKNTAFQHCISGRIGEVLGHWKRLRLITEDALDLLNKIFRYQNERITLEQILKHAFFSEQRLEITEISNNDSDSDSGSDYPLISNDISFKPSQEYKSVNFLRYDSAQSHKDVTDTQTKEYCSIIGDLQTENERLKQTVEQQKQFIKALQFSNQGLIMTAQISADIHSHHCKQKPERNVKKLKKSKKRRIKKQQKRLPNAENKSSYNPSTNHRARKNINISKKITQEIIPSKIGGNGAINWYKYMEKAIAMQLNDNSDFLNDNMVVIHYDFCDESGNGMPYYCIIEKYVDTTAKQQKCHWFMHEKLYSAKEINMLDQKLAIPQSSIAKFGAEMKNIETIKHVFSKKYEQIMNIKWLVPTFKRVNNKHRMVLRIEYQHMIRAVTQYLMKCDINVLKLIPIIMFNNYQYWMEWVCTVRILEVNVGIALVYNEAFKALKVTGVHLDKELVKEQHILAVPHHIYKCDCFDNWTSHISDIEICSDLNDNENKIRAYKQKYQSLKAFIYEFIDDNNNNCQLMKQKACSLIKYDNGSLGNTMSSIPSYNYHM